MTIDDIKLAIERRGYSVQVEHYPHSVNFRISAGEKHMNCGYTLVDLKYCKLSLTDFVNAMLYRFSGTMHPIWCKNCHEPLLPGRGRYEYRSAKAGPDSPVLDFCICRQRLYVGSVEEIQDA